MADALRLADRRCVRDPFARLVHVAGQWRITSPARGFDFELEPFEPGVLGAIGSALEHCRTPLSRAALDARLASGGLAPDERESLLAALLDCGLVGEGEPPEGGGAGEARRYDALRTAAKYVDYASAQVLDDDLERMNGYRQGGAPPPVRKRFEGAPRLGLPHPATGAADGYAARLGHLLFWAFGELREGRFFDMPMLFKAVPSMGARHALEAYLELPEGLELAAGLYHYDVAAHALARLGERGPAGRPTLYVAAVFERFQWRYRSSVSYKDVLHDLGHAQANLKRVGGELGFALRAVAAPEALPHLPPLFEDCLAAYHLEDL